MNTNMSSSSSAYKQIRNLLVVILAGILCASGFAFLMISHYGPSGQYLVSNILLAPENLSLLNFKEINPATGKTTHLIFDEVEFSYWQPKLRALQRTAISQNAYQQLYFTIQNDSSLTDAPGNISELFYTEYPATLILSVRPSEANRPENKSFQVVQFAAEGNHFRVELPEQQNKASWAYFSHPAIYQTAIQILVPSTLEE